MWESTARDLIALMLEVPEDSFGVAVNVLVPESVTARLNHAAALRKQAAEYRDQAAKETSGAARELKELGLSLRDVGAALGVSFQRAHQLVNGGKKPDQLDR